MKKGIVLVCFSIILGLFSFHVTYSLAEIHVYSGESIQAAIDNATDGDIIVLHEGLYEENINFAGKAVTLKSTNPDNPNVVYATLIDGGKGGSVVTFASGEGQGSILNGLTIQNGNSPHGGGVKCDGSYPTIINCIISKNSAVDGGGIYCIASTPSIKNCIISKNSAVDGGGIYCISSIPSITNCVIYENLATESGGGISCGSSSPDIINCTILKNSASHGGGISCDFSYSAYPSSLVITNSVIWGNTALGDVSEIYLSEDSSITFTYSDIKQETGVYPGIGNINSDPLFVQAERGNFYLQADSPCIDSGVSTNAPSQDREGIPRPQGLGIDMGAYEYVYPNSCTPRASFTADVITGGDSLGVSFDAGSSGGIDWTGAGILWDFGDGSTGSGRIVSHKYSSYGFYDVSLTITTGCGSHTLIVRDFTVGSTKPVKEVGEGYKYSSIQKAIDDSENGTLIFVYNGTYKETINFKGKEIILSSWNGPSKTIIDGSKNSSVVVFNQNEDQKSILDGFTIQNGLNSFGGGIYCDSASPQIKNCIIKDNGAHLSGGGICCGNKASPSITNCKIFQNSVVWGGGAICCYYDSSPVITDCTIFENSASYGGGIFCDYLCAPAIKDCAIFLNSASHGFGGGGIFCTFHSSPTIDNCTITKNSAQYRGGGISCNNDSSPILTHCTFFGNDAGQEGGGIFCEDSSLTIVNNILWNDLPEEIHVAKNASIEINFSDIEGGHDGVNNIDTDPQFVDSNSGDYHLLSGSLCIDSGNNFYALDKDKDGITRPIDGDCDGLAVCDLGAYEYVDLEPPRPDTDPLPDIIRECKASLVPPTGMDNCAGPVTAGTTDPTFYTDLGTFIVTWTYNDGNGNISHQQQRVIIKEDTTPPDPDIDPLPDIWSEDDVTLAPLSATDNCSGIITGTTDQLVYTQKGMHIAIWEYDDGHGNITQQTQKVIIREIFNVSGQLDQTIPDAMANATALDEIRVCEGTYLDTNIIIKGNIKLSGGWNCEFTERNPALHVTILVGGSAINPVISFIDSNTSILDGFTITKTDDPNSFEDTEKPINESGTPYSSGITCINSSPVIQNCIISGHTADNGGGIYCDNSSPFIRHCFIRNNTAYVHGGGIYYTNGSQPRILKCIFNNNMANESPDHITLNIDFSHISDLELVISGIFDNIHLLRYSDYTGRWKSGYRFFDRPAGTDLIIEGDDTVIFSILD